ncbi:hypothetical protein MPH_00375 [Macrophomina phaseolina MS6]|uniref:Uncharacterized protein n=1 Tax=Macrophomina phaseolina (strain MS6) TaxID=1126212 RepID=K2S5T3_MACPH|nr:hypothetical protein MPH_00375 [Macrophomina phaseolina MS6]
MSEFSVSSAEVVRLIQLRGFVFSILVLPVFFLSLVHFIFFSCLEFGLITVRIMGLLCPVKLSCMSLPPYPPSDSTVIQPASGRRKLCCRLYTSPGYARPRSGQYGVAALFYINSEQTSLST